MTATGLIRRLFFILLLTAPLLLPMLAKVDAGPFLPVSGDLPVGLALPTSEAGGGNQGDKNLAPILAGRENPVVVLTLSGAIVPATVDYIRRGLLQAQEMGAQLAVLKLDTPGGLDTAMREIIKDILASPVPVAVFVYPSGSRAASAGTFILYASHIAAMAPGTTLGAATPVAIGGAPPPGEPPAKPEADEQAQPKTQNEQPRRDAAPAARDAAAQKALEDAVAYIKGLAHLRGRNAEWAEKAVREAASLPAEEAAALKVVDLLATDLRDLLKQLDGQTINLPPGPITLATAEASVVNIDPDWRNRFLATITNPAVAYILMLIGIYGLILEFYSPGVFLPGVIGAISLLLALYAFHLLPISYVGLGLIFLGIAFMAAELTMPAFGVLGIGGAVAFIIGSVMLMDTNVPELALPWPLIAGATIVTIILLILIIGMALKAHKKPLVAGIEELIGAVGTAQEDFDRGQGLVWVNSELWRAKCGEPISKGQQVKVIKINGLELDIKAI